MDERYPTGYRAAFPPYAYGVPGINYAPSHVTTAIVPTPTPQGHPAGIIPTDEPKQKATTSRKVSARATFAPIWPHARGAI